ncbi:nucleotidyltransferase domain-containing protein [candidate division CSSED10-310 bacterium]|uniref:Nucleotidyltransferase domain-containing protein n=1 Tax=candidate division CSSED10-310 bacterium TaxID=2855610 RepID=A0ABV6Z232_UNCC1
MANKCEFHEDEYRELLRKITSVLEKQIEISFAYLQGTLKDTSPGDLSIAAYCQVPKAFTTDFELDMSVYIQHEAGHPVEFKIMNRTPPTFQLSVLNDGHLLYERDRKQRLAYFERIGSLS